MPVLGDPPAGPEVGERCTLEVDIAPSPVTRGSAPADEPHSFEHVEVMGEQVGLDFEKGSKLRRGAVRDCELVDDRQAGRIAERRVAGRPRTHRHARHGVTVSSHNG